MNGLGTSAMTMHRHGNEGMELKTINIPTLLHFFLKVRCRNYWNPSKENVLFLHVSLYLEVISSLD